MQRALSDVSTVSSRTSPLSSPSPPPIVGRSPFSTHDSDSDRVDDEEVRRMPLNLNLTMSGSAVSCSSSSASVCASPLSSIGEDEDAEAPREMSTAEYRSAAARTILEGPLWEFCVAEYELRIATEKKRLAENRRTIARDRILPLLRATPPRHNSPAKTSKAGKQGNEEVDARGAGGGGDEDEGGNEDADRAVGAGSRARIDLSVLPPERLAEIGGIGSIEFMVRRRVAGRPLRMTAANIEAAVIEGLTRRGDPTPQKTVDEWKRRYTERKYPEAGEVRNVETIVRRFPLKQRGGQMSSSSNRLAGGIHPVVPPVPVFMNSSNRPSNKRPRTSSPSASGSSPLPLPLPISPNVSSPLHRVISPGSPSVSSSFPPPPPPLSRPTESLIVTQPVSNNYTCVDGIFVPIRGTQAAAAAVGSGGLVPILHELGSAARHRLTE